ncbi:MAG TPA: HAMP domain-containing sensor histidine kinase [Thermoleophilaceae bacterium]|nr:HAMP domain-containing sensor histidine kinase [Thermoleophilaceae bacterium]
MSLRARIAGAAALAVALVVVIAAVAIYLGVRSELRGEVDDSLRERADLVARVADRPTLGMAPAERPGAGRGFPAPPPEPFGGPEGSVQLVLPSGDVLRPPGAGEGVPVTARTHEIARGEGPSESLDDAHVSGTHLRVLTRALSGGGAIQLARPVDEVDRQLDRVLLVLLIVGAAGVALGAALAAGVARTALAPIGHFTRRTEELAGAPDPSQRIDAGRGDELGRLARSFNQTLDSLERSVEAQRQLVADASHELRTPIASLRANIQTLEHDERLPPPERENLRADIVAELDELTALVADIVELARGTKPAELADEVRLDEIVRDVAARARARSNGVAIEIAAEPTVVRGEPARIQRAVSNLLDNALKWSPGGSTVEIDVADGGLSVRDHGPGFAEIDLPHVFERFYRADTARSMPGSGLGLAIVRQAAEAHGGEARASNAPGGGALVHVTFGDSR